MCGIVGAVASRDIHPLLLSGLKRLEYRGYDSAGMAVLGAEGQLQRIRRTGKIEMLESALAQQPLAGHVGIAHTRWATHGIPHEKNAHPFVSADGRFALAHNGIIENHAALRSMLTAEGYPFSSDTDSETAVHLLDFYYRQTQDVLAAVRKMTQALEGAYALAILSTAGPQHLIAVRHGSPLVVGCGQQGHFIASDPLALLSVTRKFIYLDEDDIAVLTAEQMTLYNDGREVNRPIHNLSESQDLSDRGTHRHYMRQEIFSQPEAIRNTLAVPLPTALTATKTPPAHILLVACGTSYHAALVARYWIESLAGIPTSVEIASEYRYRNAVIPQHTLAIFLSQSGETADTLAALRLIREKDVPSLAICNVHESSLVREAGSHFITAAGPEIGVASTKAFTTQLTALLRIAFAFSDKPSDPLKQLAADIEDTLLLDDIIRRIAGQFTAANNALFIGRDSLYPIALEGALKLKEISYIHAEGYPAGELKHGPLALVDRDMPVIALAPDNQLFQKMCSSLQEVRAREGRLFVFSDNPKAVSMIDSSIQVIPVPNTHALLAPMIHTIPLQLLAYHVAVLKGTDVDQPRNLAKSVTVE